MILTRSNFKLARVALFRLNKQKLLCSVHRILGIKFKYKSKILNLESNLKLRMNSNSLNLNFFEIIKGILCVVSGLNIGNRIVFQIFKNSVEVVIAI
jgi:hypothetical protein